MPYCIVKIFTHLSRCHSYPCTFGHLLVSTHRYPTYYPDFVRRVAHQRIHENGAPKSIAHKQHSRRHVLSRVPEAERSPRSATSMWLRPAASYSFPRISSFRRTLEGTEVQRGIVGKAHPKRRGICATHWSFIRRDACLRRSQTSRLQHYIGTCRVAAISRCGSGQRCIFES